MQSCNSPSTEKGTETVVADKEAMVGLPHVQPVPLPNPNIPGFSFPLDSATIDQWVQQRNMSNINLHAWGIWTALTLPTDETYGVDKLRVFETWHSKAEVDSMLQASVHNKTVALEGKMAQKRPLTRHLEIPAQFFRDSHLRLRALMAHSMKSEIPTDMSGNMPTFEDVSYNPVAAQTIISRQLFLPGTLDKMLQDGRTGIPKFTDDAIAIKPVYEVVPGPKHQGTARPYKMKVWANIPASQRQTPRAFDQPSWTSWVYVDITNKGQGSGQVYQNGGINPTQPAKYTYNLTDFVYHTLSHYEAHLLDSTNTVIQAGDYAILVAMHISTREIQRWTWQTVWWAPDPAHAPAPSSPAVMAAQPAQLKGAPRHYALSIAYQMITPVQPYSGGNNQGLPLYTYNPYLEAGFGISALGTTAQVRTPLGLVTDSVGTQSNCMSCHAQANYASVGDTTGPGYIGNTYVDMKSQRFKGRLQVDFLWSVANMATKNRKQRLQALVAKPQK